MMHNGLSQVSHASRRSQLAARLRQGDLVVAPGVFEMISAKMADRMGFDALYMTGYGTVASYLGLPDAGLATYTDMVNRVQQFTAITSTPMICDGDTGYGGLLNVMHTVRGYERAGACAIQLEDQEFPKKCGHMMGRRVVPAQQMVEKIRVAVESRTDPDFLIIARTDARTTLGLDEALRRAEMGAVFESVYQGIKNTGSSKNSSVPLYEFGPFSQLMGFDWVQAFDQSHAQSEPQE